MANWKPNSIDFNLIEWALNEDLGFPLLDVTNEVLFEKKDFNAQAKIFSKHPSTIYISGLALVPYIIEKFGCFIEVHSHYQDGEALPTGATLVTLEGPVRALLSLERILLNFIRHLSGIATLTEIFVSAIQHTACKILDTRKTTPGWRHLEKYAVRCGKGVNHRAGLYDAIMIKDTHIDCMGGLKKVLEQLPRSKKVPVIIEVRTLQECELALDFYQKFDRLLLDNMRGEVLSRCVDLCKEKSIVTEASGNITLDNVVEVAETGVDFISIGMLTYGAGQVDLSMTTKMSI